MKTVAIKIADLTFDPNNARKHSAKNLEAIAASLTKFGQRKPIVITPDNLILAGNGTVAAAKQLGWATVEATVTPAEWDTDTAKAFALADNRTAELAEWDSNVLATQLMDLDTSGWEIFELGFTHTDIGLFEVEEIEAPTLADGDKKPYQQITFTVHNEQAELIYQALAKVKLEQDISYPENENGNANAIYAICRGFVNG